LQASFSAGPVPDGGLRGPGCRPRLIYRTHCARRGDKRKGFTETDYARFLDAAHQQLGGPVVLVRDGLNTHTSHAMRELITARSWLTVHRDGPPRPLSGPRRAQQPRQGAIGSKRAQTGVAGANRGRGA
jgi:hypothetical protein